MVLVDYIGIFLHFRILLTDDCTCTIIVYHDSAVQIVDRLPRVVIKHAGHSLYTQMD